MFATVALASLVGLVAAAPPSYGEQPYSKVYGLQSSSAAAYASRPSLHPSLSRSRFSALPYPTLARTKVFTNHTTVTGSLYASGGNGNGAGLPAYGSGGANGASASLAAPAAPAYTPQAFSGPTPPAQTLQPARPPGHDGSNVKNLAPANQSNLYFAQAKDVDTSLQHMFASLDVNFVKPSCVLENSDHVSQVSCSPDGLRVAFSDDDGYRYAKSTWQSLGGNFILVSYTDDCNATSDGQRTFWDVSGVTFDDSSKACDVRSSDVTFDQAAQSLDMSWGTYKPNSTTSGAAGVPPSSTRDPASMITPPPSPGESLDERDILGGIESIWGKATSKIESAVSQVDNPSVSTSFSIPMQAKPTDLSNSPWGQQKEIVSFDDITLYCVDCGFDGGLEVQGQLSAEIIPPKLSSASLSLSGSIDASLGFGIQAPKGVKIPLHTESVELYSQGIPGLEIPEVVTIGPDLTFSASLGLSLEASGNLMMEAGASMDGFSATVDLVDQGNSKSSGWTPKFTGNLSAQGETTLSTTFGLPVSIGFGINFPRVPDLGQREVALVNTPGIVVAANYSDEGSCANGIGWNIHGTDTTSVNILNITNYPIYTYNTPDFASGCLSGGPAGNNASSSPSPSGLLQATRSATNSAAASTGTRSIGYSRSIPAKTPTAATVSGNPNRYTSSATPRSSGARSTASGASASGAASSAGRSASRSSITNSGSATPSSYISGKVSGTVSGASTSIATSSAGATTSSGARSATSSSYASGGASRTSSGVATARASSSSGANTSTRASDSMSSDKATTSTKSSSSTSSSSTSTSTRTTSTRTTSSSTTSSTASTPSASAYSA